MIELRRASEEDIRSFPLRPEDAREVSAGWRDATVEAGAFLAHSEDGPVALFGITAVADMASPWLLCSPLIGQHRATLFRWSRRLVANELRPQARAGTLVYNFIPKDAHGNRRFIQSLGFRILPSPRDGFDFFYLPPCVK